MVLEKERIGVGYGHVVRQTVALHHAGVPLQPAGLPCGHFELHETLRVVPDQCRDLGPDGGVALFEVLEAQRLAGIVTHAENPASIAHEAVYIVHYGSVNALQAGQEKDVVGTLAAVQASPEHGGVADNALAQIVGATAVLVYGFPEDGGPLDVQMRRERLVLRPHLRPQVTIWRQYGYGGHQVHIL